MKTYIEKSLRRPVVIERGPQFYQGLPLKYKGMYELFSVSHDGVTWILVNPKETVRLNTLRHDWKIFEKSTGLNCVLYFKNLSYYTKETMMDEGIPFIIESKQMYQPFLGMLLSDKSDRRLKPVHTISFLTQKLLLCALYERWNNVNAAKIAAYLDVSPMSVTRCLDEIEYLDLDILDTSGKTRKLNVNDDVRCMWETIRPVLRTPVIARFQLTEDIGLEKKAGISALCEYSLLSDNEYPTYAVTKKELADTKIKSYRQILPGDEIGCEVLEVGYFIDFKEENLQDPLSVLLSLSERELEEERVQICIDEMLGEYVW